MIDKRNYQLPLSVLHGIRFIDTPGFENPAENMLDTAATEKAVRNADVLFVVMNIEKGNPSGPLLQNLRRMREQYGQEHMPPAYLLISQADKVPGTKNRQKVLEKNRKKHGDTFCSFLLLSAQALMDEDAIQVEQSMDRLMHSARNAIRERLDFSLRVTGGSGARLPSSARDAPYVVDCDGVRIQLGRPLDSHLASREQLLQLVDDVRSRRKHLLIEQMVRLRKELNTHWTRTLQDVHKELDRVADRLDLELELSRAHDNDTERNQYEKRVDRLRKSLREFVCESVCFGIVTREIDEGILFRDMHAYIVFSHSRLVNAFRSPQTPSWMRFIYEMDAVFRHFTSDSERPMEPHIVDFNLLRDYLKLRLQDIPEQLAPNTALKAEEIMWRGRTDEQYERTKASIKSDFIERASHIANQIFDDDISPRLQALATSHARRTTHERDQDSQAVDELRDLMNELKLLAQDSPQNH